MKASTEQTAFGAVGVADVEEYLPQTLTEGMCLSLVFGTISQLSLILSASGGCTITIDTLVPDDKASWYELWAVAVALDGMCARGGKTGQARFLGKLFTTIVLPCHCRPHVGSLLLLGTNRKLVMHIKK